MVQIYNKIKTFFHIISTLPTRIIDLNDSIKSFGIFLQHCCDGINFSTLNSVEFSYRKFLTKVEEKKNYIPRLAPVSFLYRLERKKNLDIFPLIGYTCSSRLVAYHESMVLIHSWASTFLTNYICSALKCFRLKSSLTFFGFVSYISEPLMIHRIQMGTRISLSFQY